jgi:hypothetical protein
MRFAVFVALSLFIVAYRIFAFDGYYGWDDMAYAEYAAQLMNGQLSLTDTSHFVYRWGIIVPLAISYKLFGINDISTTLPPLLASIGTLYLLYRLTRHADIYVSIAAMLLFALDYYTLCYALRPYADVMITFFSVLMLYPLLRQSGQVLGVGSAGCVAIGLLICWVTKETALFFVPLLAFCFAYALYYRQNKRFWGYTILFSALLGIAYFAFLQYKTGTWSYRFDRIAANYYFNPCSYHLLPFSVLWHRITTGLLELLVATGMIIAMMWSLVTLVTKSDALPIAQHINSPSPPLAHTPPYIQPPISRQLIFAVLFVVFYYMPVSYQHYIPMCLDGRHFLPLVPLGALAAAPAVAAFVRKGSYAFAIIGIALIVALLAAMGWANRPMTAIYIAIVLVCCLGYIGQKKQLPAYITMSLLAAVLCLHPVYVMFRATDTGYALQTAIVKQYLLQNTQRKLVVSDDLNENLGKYYTHFDPNAPVVFVNYADYCPEMLQMGNFEQLYVLSNHYTNRNIMESGYTVPNYMLHLPPNCTAIADSGGIKLYRANAADLD